MHLGEKQRTSGLLIGSDIQSCYIRDAPPWYKENEKSPVHGEFIWLILSDKIQVNEQNLEGRLEWWRRQGIHCYMSRRGAKAKINVGQWKKPGETAKYWENSRRNKTKWPEAGLIPHHISQHSQIRPKKWTSVRLHQSSSPLSAAYEKESSNFANSHLYFTWVTNLWNKPPPGNITNNSFLSTKEHNPVRHWSDITVWAGMPCTPLVEGWRVSHLNSQSQLLSARQQSSAKAGPPTAGGG